MRYVIATSIRDDDAARQVERLLDLDRSEHISVGVGVWLATRLESRNAQRWASEISSRTEGAPSVLVIAIDDHGRASLDATADVEGWLAAHWNR